MNDDHSKEDLCGSRDRNVVRNNDISGDNNRNSISKKFEKNTICQEKRSPHRGQMKNWKQLSDMRKPDMKKTQLRLLRLSQKNIPLSGRVIGDNHDFNNSMDQITWRNILEFHCDNESSSVIPGQCKKSEINEDWGKRTELHNIFNVNDGDKVWNIIRRGLFGEIKLWKNEYGSFCCKATGKISVKGISEKSIVEINTENNLRKLLNLSHMQWSALCEALDEKNIPLSFNAFENVDMNKKSSLEKLWFFICKRRHFLPNICVLGKLSGAVKLMKELLIMPKIVVTEIRDFRGEEIS